MAETANTLWVRSGTVSVTNNSTKVTGVGTNWTTKGINPGATFRIDGLPYACEVKRVVSDTEIVLVKPYYGTSASAQSYSIDRNFQSTLPAKIAAEVTDLVGIYEQVRDGVYLTIEGKSAYQVAVANGYSGTVTQWLESLKGAGDYTALLSEITPYRQHNAGAHNAHYYEKNLGGGLTEAQSAAIRAGTFTDMYPGGYWSITFPAYQWEDAEGTKHDEASGSAVFRIGGCDYYLRAGDADCNTHHLVIVPDSNLFSAPMNSTDTTKGGYLNSEMVTNYLKRAEALVKAAFGADHILEHREYLQNAVTNGRPSGGTWVTRTVDLMTEQMVYGGKIFGVASDGGSTVPNLYTVSKSQLPLFQHNPRLISNRQWYWLRDVVNDTSFAYVTSFSYATYSSASNVGGVRPYVPIH